MKYGKLVRRFGLLAIAVASGIAVSGPMARADGIERNAETAGERIAIASRQNMLAEGLAKSMCYIHSGIDTEHHKSDLYVNWNIYRWYHRGIFTGNVQLGLFQEENTRVRNEWLKVDRAWLPLERSYDHVIDGGTLRSARFNDIMTMTDAVIEQNDKLVALMRSTYAGDVRTVGDASTLIIDLYQRGRTLAQRLSKEVCLVETGYETEATRGSLNETMGHFEVLVDGLVDGLPSVGLPPAPTPELRAQLTTAREKWNEARPVADAVATGAKVSAEDLSQFGRSLNLYLSEMNIAVRMLIEHQSQSS